ncbi:MAG: EAL domain-containing protein [Hyphomicrobiaceae bacterium]
MALSGRVSDASDRGGDRDGHRGAALAPALAVARSLLILLMFAAVALTALPQSAFALKPIVISPDQDRVEITTLGEAYEGRGDSLMVETAAGADGTSGRMSVRAATAGTNPNWMVFALTNPTDKSIERWLTADRFTIVGSGIVWPDLDARRIESVTPSIGFVPQRIKSDRADIFALTLEPGQTITYVAELSSERFARIYLWKPLEYEVKVRDRQLYYGIMLGLTVLTAIFLTAIFAANHKIIFPAAALFSWCVLAYLGVDFGFFHKLFNLKPEDNAVYRAAAEAAMAASLVMFLYAFLRLGLSHGLIRLLAAVWILAQLALVAVAAIDPRLAATFARFSFLAIGGIGAMLILFLALRRQDRALHLLPTWILFLTWIFLAGVVLTGRLSGEIFTAGLTAGLVLVVLLIGFTVTQFAFRSLGPLAGLTPTDSQLRAIAVDSAGSAVWEWSNRRDEIKVGGIVEEILGLNPGELNVKVEEFVQHVHPTDRERFRLMLWSVQERSGGKINAEFRMRHADNSYRWFELEAASIATAERRVVRCVGLIRDVTETRMAQDRLMHDAVHCHLTGLPNRELLNDRLAVAMQRAKSDVRVRPTVFYIDIDRFKAINSMLGLLVGDSVLLTVARRLQRHLGPFDTLARIGGDRFAILFVDEQEPRELAQLAERVRRSLRSPIKIASREIVLTGSLGIAIYDGDEDETGGLLKEAEIAMYRAKRTGADRIEIFKPEMRAEAEPRKETEEHFARAIEKGAIKVLYQPIVSLATVELAGFETSVRWEHPKHGLVKLGDVVDIVENVELIRRLGTLLLLRALEDAKVWQRELPRLEDSLFVSVNLSSRAMLVPEFVQEVRHALARTSLAKGTLRLEVAEQILMENPEHAVVLLEQLRGAGAELVLDQYGASNSSLAYLARFPCDTVKMHQGILSGARQGGERGTALLRAVVAMTHELGRKVVADGIETPEDVTFLRSTGCEMGQGYFYGAPMTEREVVDLVRVIRKSERKLRTHGLFKTKQRSARKAKRKSAEAKPTAVDVAAPSSPTGMVNGMAGAPNGATAPASSQGGAQARPLSQLLPNSTVRPRQRPAGPPPATVPAAPAPAPSNTSPAQASAPQAVPPNLSGPVSSPTVRTGPPTVPPPSQVPPVPPPPAPARTAPNQLVPRLAAAAAPPPPPPSPARSSSTTMPPPMPGGAVLPQRPGLPNGAGPPAPAAPSVAANGAGRGAAAPAAAPMQRSMSPSAPPPGPPSATEASAARSRPLPAGSRSAPPPPRDGNQAPPPIAPDTSALSSGLAASLARLAGIDAPEDDRKVDADPVRGSERKKPAAE